MRIPLPKIEIKNDMCITHVYVDGEELHGVNYIMLRQNAGELPLLILGIKANEILVDTNATPELPEPFDKWYERKKAPPPPADTGNEGYTDSITKGWLTVAYRVRALDDQGAYGDYTTSETREVNNNTPPEITCEFSGDLGEKSADFSIPYTVSDEEGDSVTVTESLDGTQLRTFTYTNGPETCQVAGEGFMKLSNGPHKLTISATDGKGISTHELAFQKLATAASVTLIEPMEADAEINVCVLSVSGEIPEDADFKVEATNNGLDDEPVWEDCTMAVRTGMNHVFENKSAANGFAFNFRLHVERGESGADGFITSVQGGFQ